MTTQLTASQKQLNVRTQSVLAQLLRQPWSKLADLVRESLPGAPNDEIQAVVVAARRCIQSVLRTEQLQPRSGEPATPVLVDRLAFCWTVIRKAEAAIRKQKKENVEGDPLHVVEDLLWDMFAEDMPLTEVFVRELCALLGLEPDGRFLRQYHGLKKVQSNSIALSFVDAPGIPSLPNIRRVAWWLILRRNDEYIHPHSGGVENRFPYLVNAVREDLETLCSAKVAKLPGVREEIEEQINRWLEYCCIEGQHSPADSATQLELARTFVKAFNLKVKVHFTQPGDSTVNDHRVRELENEVNRYAEENKKLEEQLRALEAQFSNVPAVRPPKSEPQPGNSGALQSLYEALKAIDAKYSLDALHAVQLGEEAQFGMKNLLSHFFYVLRKKGLMQYPSDETSALHYDQSGLFDCSDFVVPPGEAVQIAVVRHGWAFKGEQGLLPIRKAVVRLVRATEAVEEKA